MWRNEQARARDERKSDSVRTGGAVGVSGTGYRENREIGRLFARTDDKGKDDDGR
jgi:hypothetical protein